MRCLIYALNKWAKEGGYLCIRRCRSFPLPLPHFLHATELKKFSHETASVPIQSWWKELWYILTGKYYMIKIDED